MRRTCSITWLAWTTSNDAVLEREAVVEIRRAHVDTAARAAAACSSISSMPLTLAAPSRAATRMVNSPSLVPRSRSRAPGRGSSAARIPRRFSSSVALNTRER